MQSVKPKHSPIGASSFYRWSACPGSVRLCRDIPPSKSKWAEEGTLAHEIAAGVLLGTSPTCEDPEMETHVSGYVDFVLNEAEGCDLFVEESFDLSEQLFDGLYGTADAVIWDKKTKTLTVIDFKYGAGVAVDARDNPQLKYYALGALLTLGFPAVEVRLVIYQPRAFHPDGPVRGHVFEAFDLLEFSAELVDYAKKTTDPTAPLSDGEHCRFCPALALCPKVSERALAIAKSEFSDPMVYDKAKLKSALDFIPALKEWIKSVESFAYDRLSENKEVPGYKLVEKRSTRKWKSENEVINFCREQGMLDDEIFDSSIKSPAQLEKKFDRAGKEKLKEFVTQSSSGLTIVEESDKRPAAFVSAQTEFNVID